LVEKATDVVWQHAGYLELVVGGCAGLDMPGHEEEAAVINVHAPACRRPVAMFEAQELCCPRRLAASEMDQRHQVHEDSFMQLHIAMDGLVVPAVLTHKRIHRGEAGTLRQG
jgi:hypothetical protein